MKRNALLRPLQFILAVLSCWIMETGMARAADFRVPPYVQNPAPDAMTVTWFSNASTSGTLTWSAPDGIETTITVLGTLATALSYHAVEVPSLPGAVDPGAPYIHTQRIINLTTETLYSYRVKQDASQFTSQFRTSPAKDSAIRIIYYSDCETEPESSGKFAAWTSPTTPSLTRNYPVDMTHGYQENLKVIGSRSPDLIVIGGDLAESGGEQRDWDEFWRQNTGPYGIAGSTPILPALGNHEYYGGPGTSLGGYNQPRSEAAVAKFRAYFDAPPNGSPNPLQEKRYYRVNYGPAAIIVIDCVNGLPNSTTVDGNYYLLGETEGGQAPDFNPGSRQYQWLENELQDAQKTCMFTFVVFHHIPFSVGPHGWPPGPTTGSGYDNQSGVPTRVLLPLFHRYGVDAILSGHDEMYERSEDQGTEVLPDGSTRASVLQVYDVGIGGDGVRGPETGLSNPNQKFLAHTNAPEQWNAENIMLGGGKHYGHLEINVQKTAQNKWEAVLTPVYVFPLMEKIGASVQVTGFERRTYNDEITLIHETNSSIDPILWMTW